MRSLRLACLVSMLVSTNLFAQSDSIPVNSFLPAKPNQPIGLLQADAASQGKIVQSYGKLSLTFEPNQGQTDARVKFLSRTGGYTLFLTGDEAVLALRGSKTDTNKAKIAGTAHTSGMAEPKTGGVLRMKLRNANPAAKVTGVDELAGTSNYFIGNDPAKWRTNVPTYAR